MADAISMHIAEKRLERICMLTQRNQVAQQEDTGRVSAGRWPRVGVPVASGSSWLCVLAASLWAEWAGAQ